MWSKLLNVRVAKKLAPVLKGVIQVKCFFIKSLRKSNRKNIEFSKHA